MEDREVLEKQALKDYNRGRLDLSVFANREGVPVFEKINEAQKFRTSNHRKVHNHSPNCVVLYTFTFIYFLVRKKYNPWCYKHSQNVSQSCCRIKECFIIVIHV